MLASEDLGKEIADLELGRALPRSAGGLSLEMLQEEVDPIPRLLPGPGGHGEPLPLLKPCSFRGRIFEPSSRGYGCNSALPVG